MNNILSLRTRTSFLILVKSSPDFCVNCHLRSSSTSSTSSLKPPDFDYDKIRSLKPFPSWLTQEMRSNHAGETGAVNIYAGAKWALHLRQRTNSKLFPFSEYEEKALSFASHHQETEAQHLLAFDRILDPGWTLGQRSKFLPAWRVAGFSLGAVSTLWCSRGLYVTTDAVETFVDKHYTSQIERLKSELEHEPEGDEKAARTELLKLLQHCCEDEVDHRDEARSRAAEGPFPWWPWVDEAWKWLVENGSAAAAGLAKRA